MNKISIQHTFGTESITAERHQSILECENGTWGKNTSLHTPLRKDFLAANESAELNISANAYLTFIQSERILGHANLIVSRTDFSTLDHSLAPHHREAIKRWYPRFMEFGVVENGFFTMIGKGHAISDLSQLSGAMKRLDQEMEQLGRDTCSEVLLIRDIPADQFDSYNEALRPLGYYPALGFANAALQIRWKSIQDYLSALSSKTRHKLSKAFSLKQAFDIDVEFRSDFSELAEEFAQLWRNVNGNSRDYNREKLGPTFFRSMAGHLPENAEALLFRHKGKLIAFMLNLYGEDDYIVLDWGVDYAHEHYRKASLYRAATVLSLARAIERGKQRLELGITNYSPKLTLGAEIIPLVYFIRHINEPRYSRTLARMLTENIQQPDNRAHDSVFRTGAVLHDIPAVAAGIEAAQGDFADTDIFRAVDRYHRANNMRIAGIYGLYPEFNCAQGSSITCSDGRELVLLGTNSYLGAATHPRVVQAAKAAIERYGTGCSGSPLLNGTLDIHNALERELAQFVARDAVMLCSTGYQTNLAALSALCGPGDAVLMDSRNHRSLFDGVRLSGADCLIYRHADLHHLERLLTRLKGRPTLIVTDSLFSMEGVIADLPRICELAHRHGARLFVDESHAIGVLGQRGRGVCELQGVESDVDLIMGTFSKSFAAVGGFVAGDREVIDSMKHTGSGHIFSASLPAAVVETVRTVLRLMQDNQDSRREILDKARYMATELKAMGYRARFGGSQIVPVVLGNFTLALAAYKRFMDSGVYVNPVGPPAVPEEAAGFRTSYMATHQWRDLDRALEIFRQHAGDFAIGEYFRDG